jgi:putative ABC transport system permease protein
MWFLSLVFRNLFRRTTRTALTVVAAAVAIGTVVALIGVVNKFRSDFMGIYTNRNIDLVVLRAGIPNQVESVFPQDIQSDIEKIAHVRAVTPGLITMTSFPDKQLYSVPLSGRVPGSIMMENLTIKEGRPLTNEKDEKGKSVDARGVMLGKVLASRLGKKVGDKVPLFEKEFTVVGVFEANALEDGAAVILFSELQKLNYKEGKVTALLVAVEMPDSASAENATATKSQYIEEVRRDIQELTFKDEYETPFKLIASSTQDHALNAPQLMLADALVLLISTIALILGSVGMLNTMLMSVFERTREIGILRALGWRKSRILWMVLWESWFVCFCGAILGVAGAYVVIWAVSFHPTISNISPGLPGTVWMQGVLVALVMGFVGGIYPAVRAAMLLPTEAVRHE